MKSEPNRYLWWPLYIFYTLLAFVVLRFGFSSTGLCMHWRPDYDANIYHLIGRGWMEGIRPYVQLSDLKGPLVFLQCGLGSLISPNSFLGASLLQAPVVGLGLLYACKCASLFVGRGWGLVASGLLFIYVWYFGVNPSATVLTMQYISLYHVLKCLVRGESLGCWPVYAMGLFVGLVLLIKFNLAAFWVPLVLHTLMCKEWWRQAGLLLAGLATVLLPVCVGLAWAGLLTACWQEYVLTAVRYGSSGVEHSALVQSGWELLAEMLPEHLYKKGSLILKAVCGGVQLFLWLLLPRLVRVLCVRAYYMVLGGSFLLSLVAIFGGQYHYSHYYFSFLPFVLLSLVCAVRVFQRSWVWPRQEVFAGGIGVLLSVLLALLSALLAVYVKEYRPHNGVAAICHSSQSLVRCLQGNTFVCTDPSACLHLYRLTGTTPPIRHFVPQMVPHGQQKHHQELLKCIQNNQVRYLVCTMVQKNHTEKLIRESGIPYRRILLTPPDFPPYPPLTAYTPFCLYERL